MSTYSVVNNSTGEIVLETDSKHLQAANKLLLATSSRQGLRQATSNRLSLRERHLHYADSQRSSNASYMPAKPHAVRSSQLTYVRGHYRGKKQVNALDELILVGLCLVAGLVLVVVS